MNPIYSIRILDGSMTLVSSMRANHILPCDVESPGRVLEVLVVVVGICVVCSNRVFRFTILMSNALFISVCKLTIVVIDLSKDSCTNVAMLL